MTPVIISNGPKNVSLPITVVSNDVLTVMTIPYLLRVASYLTVCVIDAYMFRPPLQREKDRVYMFQYGSIMYCCSTVLPVSLLLFVCLQSYKIYFIFYKEKDEASASSAVDYNNNNNHNTLLTKGVSKQVAMMNRPKLKCPLERVFRDCKNSTASSSVSAPFHHATSLNLSILNSNPMNSATIHHPSPAIIPSNNNNNAGINMSHTNNAAHAGTILDINYNDLDIQEAFRLAKLQYSANNNNGSSESKATV